MTCGDCWWRTVQDFGNGLWPICGKVVASFNLKADREACEYFEPKGSHGYESVGDYYIDLIKALKGDN